MASDDEEPVDLEMTKGDSPIKTPAKSESSSNNEAFEQQNSNNLWTAKYMPRSPNDLVGNVEVIENFKSWLLEWDRDAKKPSEDPEPGKKKKWKKEGAGRVAKACMISGPPGIGKTSMVKIIAESIGMETMFINASDKRSKNVIESMLKELTESSTMDHFRKGSTNLQTLVVMDEVDGCSGNSDRGGIAALIKVIKSTKMPIVCIANDHGSRKIISLNNHCYDLRFQKPCQNEILVRLEYIAKKERIKIER